MMPDEDLVEFEEAVGRVEEYDPSTGRAKLRVDTRELQIGDLIEIMGAMGDAPDVVTIQDILMADEAVQQAPVGTVVEISVPRPVSYLDDVFLVKTAPAPELDTLVPVSAPSPAPSPVPTT